MDEISIPALRQAEYEALRATIRERGTARLCALLAGIAAWALVGTAVVFGELQGAMTLAPLLVLAATYEVSYFIHTGVERIGRYVQVHFEEHPRSAGWETTAMEYGAKYPGGLDPLFASLFYTSLIVNFLGVLSVALSDSPWTIVSLLGTLVLVYRIVTTKRRAAVQRAVDLDRFRALAARGESNELV